jgi:CRP/FNR family transcriptional regulator, cyclic AMP receptor protein
MGFPLSVVRQSTLLCVLSDESFTSLVTQGQTRRYGSGSMILMPGDRPDEMYMIESGCVTILLTSPDGREIIIDELGPGEFFGEVALLTRTHHMMMAVSREQCELLALPAAVIYRLLEQERSVQCVLLEHVAVQLETSLKREEALAFLAAPARIARVLRLLHEAQEDIGYITTSQEEIAQRTGLIRQTVAGILGQWRRQQWLITGRGRIVVLNLPALAKIEQQALL